MCEINTEPKQLSESTLYPLVLFFLAILVGTILDFWKYGPYITPDTIGYFNMIQGKDSDLTTLSPFYGFFLSVFPFSLLSIFDRIMVSGILMFLLAFYLIIKISSKFKRNRISYLLVFGISILSWWSFRILGRAHADSHFYVLFLFWVYLFIWEKERSKRYFILICCLSALMVWVKLNTLFLIPLLILWVLISNEKQWIYVILAIIFSWLLYKWILPDNILDLHLSNQVLLQTDPVSQSVLLYENLSTWFTVSLGIFFSDVVTQEIPIAVAFLFTSLCLFLQLYYLIRFSKRFENPIYKLLLISFIYSLFFMFFQQWIGYKEINFRTLFPHLLVLSLALWIYLIQNHKKNTILIIAFFITTHTLIGHYVIWQRNDVYSLFTAKKFDRSEEKKSIETILEIHQQRIFTDAPEKIMLSFSTREVLQIAPKNRFIEGKNYPLNENEMEIAHQKSMASLLNGSAIIVLFHPSSLNIKINNIPQISSITEKEMTIFYLDQSAK